MKTFTVTKKMITTEDWYRVRDQALQIAELILIELPNTATARGSATDRKIASRIASLIDNRGSIPAYIFGPLRSNSWDLSDTQLLFQRQDMHKSVHQWCAWGAMHPILNVPIGRTTQVLSTVKVRDTKCTCPEGTMHRPYKESDQSDTQSVAEIRVLNRQCAARGTLAVVFGHGAVATGADLNPTAAHHEFAVQERTTSNNHNNSQSQSSMQSVSHSETHNHPTLTTAVAFPTDSKEKQKEAQKEREHQGVTRIVKKKVKYHEKHYDDCGESMEGLGADHLLLHGFSDDDECLVDEDHDNSHLQVCSGIHWFTGSLSDNPALRQVRGRDQDMFVFNSMQAMETYHSRLNHTRVAVCEVAGGEARVSKVLASYRCTVGRNFDLVTGTDLTDPKEQAAFMRYRNTSKVQVVVMSPICSPFGGWGRMNRSLYPETWQSSVNYALKLGSFCGEIALAQYNDGKDWLNEQPAHSTLYDYKPWPEVRRHPRTVVGKFHQCQCGAKTADGQHIIKPTELWASDYDLIYYLDGLLCGTIKRMCNGQHVELRGDYASKSQVWPWGMAERIVWGIQRLLIKRRWQSSHFAVYAADDAGQDSWKRCPGCRRRRPADHREHTRVEG